MTTPILFEDIGANKFKDTLFETVSYEPWRLEYKIIFLETRKALDVLITEWLDTCEKYMMLTEAADAMTDEQADEIINRFLARKTLPRTAIDNLHGKLSGQAEGKKGWLKTLQSLASKFLAPIHKGLDKLSKITTFPQVDDRIQSLIAKIDSKTDDKLVKKLLNMIRNFTKNKKASFFTSAVLLILGVMQSLWSLPFVGTTIIGMTVTVAAIRIISDLSKGKSIAYSVGKAAALFGAGYGIKELFYMGMSWWNQVEDLQIHGKPTVRITTGRDFTGADSRYPGGEPNWEGGPMDSGASSTPLAAVQQDPYAIQHIKDPSIEVQLAAVKQNGRAILFIKDPSIEVQLAAIQQNPWAIEDIQNPSEQMQMAAVQQDGEAIRWIKNPSEQVQMAAVQQDGEAIQFIKDPSPQVQLAAVRQNVSAIQFIKDPSPEVQLAASSHGEIPGDEDHPGRALGGPMTNIPSTGNSYIDKLQDLYGAPIESYSGSFRDAFAAARKELGSGGIFSWTNPATGELEPFTTNTKGEGQFANMAANVVNYLRRK